MGNRMVERRLRKVGGELRRLRDELRVIDEQLAHLVDEADDASLRAIVADAPDAGPEGRRAREHADAMRRHRDHVARRITELEARQDELLDALAPGT